MKHKTILVTGGAGFLGSHLIKRLLDEDPEKLAIIDDLSLGKEENISCALAWGPKTIVFHKGDAGNSVSLDWVFSKAELERFDVCYHLAVSPLPESLTNPAKVFLNNIRATVAMCELTREGKIGRLVHISSSEVYGTTTSQLLTESTRLDPLTPYAASKAACDELVLSYKRTFGLDIIIARPGNFYGPRQNENSYAAVIPITMKRITDGLKPIMTGTGYQTRDFSYVTDIADGVYQVGQYVGRHDLFNLCTGIETPIRTLLDLISIKMGYPGDYEIQEGREGDVRRHAMSNEKALAVLNWEPNVDLADGLDRTIKWFESEKVCKTK